VYTDGSCLGNPGPGGWGAIVLYDDNEESYSGGEAHTTNNKMELMAVIKALCSIKSDINAKIEIYTDSNYVKNGITSWISGWKKVKFLPFWNVGSS
jgi:ribonuclease HI